jgi:hypothetical protein
MHRTGDAAYHREWARQNAKRIAAKRRQQQKRTYQRNKDYVNAAKVRTGACEWCQMACTADNVHAFDWDHIDPATKRFNLAECKGYAIPTVAAEILKCRLLCKICHADHTKQSEHWKARRDIPDTNPIHQQLELFEEGTPT